MDDSRALHGGEGLPVQGPHWQHDPDAGLIPLRLILQPSGFAVDLTRAETVIGRNAEADLRLPLPDVSRRHCRIVHQNGIWQVFDLQSMNGVFVNGVKIEQETLRHRDLVRVGGFTFQVDLASNRASTPVPGGRPRGQVLQNIADALPSRQDGTLLPHKRQAS